MMTEGIFLPCMNNSISVLAMVDLEVFACGMDLGLFGFTFG